MIHVLLVDEHASFREAVAFRLASEPDIRVVEQTATCADAVAAIESPPGPDVALVDVAFAGELSGLIEGLHSRHPQAAVIVLAPDRLPATLAAAMSGGAAGVFSTTDGVDDLIDLVRRAGAGESLISQPELAALVRRLNGRDQTQEESARIALLLTTREREILQLLVEGLSGREIAERLSISRQTQRTHVTNILGKLAVHSQMQAVLVALRHGIVQLPEG